MNETKVNAEQYTDARSGTLADPVDAYVSIGSNVDREANVISAVKALRRRFGTLRLSPVYDNPAVGFDGADFLNLVAVFEARERPVDVVNALRRIEQRHGRLRNGDSFDDRTLDLDLLIYGDLVCRGPELALPREEIDEQPHVLKPLLDLWPAGIHPRTQQPLAALWEVMAAGENADDLVVVQLPL